MTEPIYVNNAGTSWPKAPGVTEASSVALAAAPEASRGAWQAARAETCRMFGIEQPERLLLTGSCTAALSLLIGDFPLQEGDVVLTSALEHHALTRPIQQLVRTRGVVHEAAPYAPGAPFDLDYARGLLRGGQVRLIAVTAASNVTGELLPVDALGRLAREHGVPLLLDAAQAACLTPIDLKRMPVDMLVFAAHKGPLAPHGIGGLWVAPHVELQSPSALCEIGAGPRSTHSCASFPSDCDLGSLNLAAAAGLAAAVRWQLAQGDALYDPARALATRLRRLLREQPGCRVFGAEDAPHTATLSFLLDGLPLARAESHFAARAITLRAGQHCAPLALEAIGAVGGTIRVSFGPFNRADDVDAIAAAVADAVGAG